MNTLISIIAILAVFVVPIASIAWVLVTLINSCNKKNYQVNNDGVVTEIPKSMPNNFLNLRNGCLFTGVAIGLIVAMCINLNTILDDGTSFLVVCASTALFLGIGYLVFYFLVKNKNLDTIEYTNQ